MNTPLHVVVATDFSALARHAAERAAQLAQASGLALRLVHVMPAGPLHSLRQWLGEQHPVLPQLQAQAQSQLDQWAADFHHSHGIEVRTVLATGAVLAELLREAQAGDAAWLVLGARGEGFLRRHVLGATAERLLRRTNRPVLVVRQRPQAAYRRVLVALDFSPWSEQALWLARQVAPQAQCVLFHAFSVPLEGKLHFAGVSAATIDHYRQQARTYAVQQVHALAQKMGLSRDQWTPCIVEGEPSQCLREQEVALDCDLVVLGKHGQSATEDVLLGSVTHQVLSEGQADVLVSTVHTP